jgi:hypothetical protein
VQTEVALWNTQAPADLICTINGRTPLVGIGLSPPGSRGPDVITL